MLIYGVAEVVHVERATPVGHHRLVVVGPTVAVGGVAHMAVGAHRLDVVHTHHGRESAIVQVGVRELTAGVVDAVGGLRCGSDRQCTQCQRQNQHEG